MERNQSTGSLALLALLTFLALHTLPTRAQVPDSTRARPDSLVAPALLALPGPDGGRAVTAVPFTTPALDPADALAEADGVFVYDLGLPGAPDGLSLDGLAPERPALTLDGRPLTDLFTGRPRADLLPFEVLDRLRLDDGAYGRPGELAATVRPFRFAAPVTELRYLTGQEGVQFISVTHAQTRLPPGFLRDGENRARWTVLAHVAGRSSTGAFAGGALGGWHGLGRITYARPGLTAVLTETHVRRSLGARTGLAPNGAFSTVFNPFQARVLDGEAERATVRNDLALDLHAPLFGPAPLTATAYWTRQHERFTPLPGDTLEAKGNRFGGRLVQPIRAGSHGLALRLDGWLDGAPWGRQAPLADVTPRAHVHVALRDTVRFGGWRAEAEAGVHAVGDRVFPAGHVHVERGGFVVGGGYAGTEPGRIEEAGFADLVIGTDAANRERTLSARAGWAFAFGAFDVRVRAYGRETRDPRVLVAEADTAFAFVDAEGVFRRVGGTLELGWREAAPRGLYATAAVSAHAFLNPDDSVLHRREASALPDVRGHGRLGFRALDLFDGRLDLDLALRGRAWGGFRSRVWVPAVALFALADPDAATAVPARGTLDVVAEARFQERASVFLVYENALATRAYDGAYVVPVFPLPAHRLRFGVAWALFD